LFIKLKGTELKSIMIIQYLCYERYKLNIPKYEEKT